MPTPKQERAVRNIVELRRNKGEALLDAGYSKSTAIKPSQVTNSKGFKEAARPLVEKLQLEIDAIMEALPHKRCKAGYGEMGTVLKTLIDKKELLSGKPTQIHKIDRLDELNNSDLERLAAGSLKDISKEETS